MNGWIAAVGAIGSIAYKASADDALRTALQGLAPPAYYLRPRYQVSLVVPAFQEHKYIGSLLRSAHNQVEPFWELIVADSSDPGEGTAQIARSWGARVVQAPRGNISRSRNLGAAAARGDVLVFADADCILNQQFVASALDALERGAVLVHSRMALTDSMGWHLAMHGPQLLRGNLDTGGCVAISAADFRALGGYDESFQAGSAEGHPGEDRAFGSRVQAVYGPGSVRVLPMYIGVSARRWKKFGFFGGGPQFATPVRARLPRDGVQSVTRRR